MTEEEKRIDEIIKWADEVLNRPKLEKIQRIKEFFNVRHIEGKISVVCGSALYPSFKEYLGDVIDVKLSEWLEEGRYIIGDFSLLKTFDKDYSKYEMKITYPPKIENYRMKIEFMNY